ncbi:MAG: hypothetical protein JNL62_07675, partial [Bryobacterales bacterium]|nr:hypothetical protein [Bryobacterales bacterium]
MPGAGSEPEEDVRRDDGEDTGDRGAHLILSSIAVLCAVATAQPFDVLLRNGTVIDGTGAKPYRADVAIRNGFIHRIGDLSRERASIELDVTGLVVAPGFINLHSHVSPAGVATAVNMLTQGVTTEIANADGSGATDLAMQMQRFRAAGMALNVGAYIGFNVVWASVMGQEDRRPTTAEIERMR